MNRQLTDDDIAIICRCLGVYANRPDTRPKWRKDCIELMGAIAKYREIPSTSIGPHSPFNFSTHPLRNIWTAMNKRCYDEKQTSYSRYGGRGIGVCEEWRMKNENDDGNRNDNFVKFFIWAIGNGWEERVGSGKLSIDRIDGNVGYSPANCRFVTSKVQRSNAHCSRNYNAQFVYWKKIGGVEENMVFYSTYDATVYFGLSDDMVGKVVRGERRSTHGCTFWKGEEPEDKSRVVMTVERKTKRKGDEQYTKMIGARYEGS